MDKLIDTLYILYYLLLNNYIIILISLLLIFAFFTTDFIIWSKTNKSLWHKIIDIK